MCEPTEAHTRDGRGDRRGPEKVVIFGTYNIRNGRNRGPELALIGLEQVKVDCGVMHETKLTDGIYTR